jgi:AraC-like DNA-binding protein
MSFQTRPGGSGGGGASAVGPVGVVVVDPEDDPDPHAAVKAASSESRTELMGRDTTSSHESRLRIGIVSAVLFTFRQLGVLRELVEARGADMAALLRGAGIDGGARGEITAPLVRVQALLDDAATKLGAPLLGLELAERIPRGAFGITEFVVRASPTVRHGLAALCETSPLINPPLEMRYVADRHGCEIRFTYAAQSDVLGVQLNEYTVSVIQKSFASVLGTELPVERAWFAHARRMRGDEVARRFGCPVSFGAVDCGFAVSSEVIDRTIANADAPLYEYLLAQARGQLANMGSYGIVAQVVRVLDARLAVAEVSAEAVAVALGTTARSLQRHLAEEGTTFRDVLARVRRRRRDELQRTGLVDAEIATRLGFANVRTMRRSLDEGGEPDEA